MDELGKSFPAAEGMVDAEQAATGGHHNETCLNCGTKLIDTFCYHCGQKDIPRRQTLGELLTNFISSFWSYEGKFFLTTKFLITKPGFLATEYNAGKRESYYHPARMYVFISFVFFLLLVSLPDSDSSKRKSELQSRNVSKTFDQFIPLDKGDYRELKRDLDKEGFNGDSLLALNGKWNADSSEFSIQLDELASLQKQVSRSEKKKNKDGDGLNFSLSESKYSSLKEYDSLQNTLPEEKKDGWIKRALEKRTIELVDKYKGDMKKFGEDFMQVFTDNFSKVLFWLLPIFALLLKLLYVRRNFYYSEHLVFTIYYYNFFFLAGSIQMLVNQISWLEWLGTVIGFWIFFYLLFGMKRMYLQTWGKTIFKFFTFCFLFFFCLSLALGISAMVVLLVI
jgi:Protein of unknown function (DUF3667)